MQVFDEMLAPEVAGIARWTTGVGERPIAAHRSLGAALAADGQAFLGLLDGGVVTGPRIQCLPTGFAGGSWSGPRVAPDTPDAFIVAGRLAFLWFPGAEPDPIRGRFEGLVRVAWRALYAATNPHLVRADGRPARSARIGAAAERWAVEHPGQQLVAWGEALRLR